MGQIGPGQRAGRSRALFAAGLTAGCLSFALGCCALLAGCQGAPSSSRSASTASPSFPASAAPPSSTPGPDGPSTPAQRAAALTDEALVGQLFLTRPQDEATEEETLELVRRFQPGGLLFFAQDFEFRTPGQFAAFAARCGAEAEVPLLLGADEEGGTVARASRFSQYRDTPFLSPQQLYAQGGLDAVAEDAAGKCAFLTGLGLNLNMAPVCDISQDPADYIYPRTLGQNAAATAEYVSRVVQAMAGSGVGCVLKHFPGYGGNADTHTGIARDGRSLETLRAADFLPFAAGIEAGAGAVLVSHNIVACLDDTRPASLSPAVYALLRQELGFTGVAVTDDLVMEAIARFAAESGGCPAVLALEAGADLLCCKNIEEQYPAVLEALRSGRLSRARLEESAARILVWKESQGLV